MADLRRLCEWILENIALQSVGCASIWENILEVDMTHTKGPWDTRDDDKRITVGCGLVEGPNGYDVAEVYNDDCDRDEAWANARLIAAAPDLLDAITGAMDILSSAESNASGTPDWDYVGPRVAAVRAAIARATLKTLESNR